MSELHSRENDWVLLNFLNFEKGLNGGSSHPFHSVRKDAFKRFSDTGFPLPSEEEWRYTNVAEIREGGFALATRTETSPAGFSREIVEGSLARVRVTLVNGFFDEARSDLSSLPKGLKVTSLAKGLKDPAYAPLIEAHLAKLVAGGSGFDAFNTAFAQDGVVLHFDRGALCTEWVEIFYITDSATSVTTSPRVLLVAEEGAQGGVVEVFAGAPGTRYFTSHVTEISVAANARIDHYRLQQESLSAFHVSTIRAWVGADASLKTHTFSFGGKLVRNNVEAVLGGKGGAVTMNGLSVLTGAQHVDNHTLLDHAEPHCESVELYKGIYADSSQGVFSGSIIVRPGAQKTNAIQANRALLLSDQATINAKPQLKIWADDVKCTHGATVGQLDTHALFYLRSRGIPLEMARNMLIHAFASEVISEVNLESLRVRLEGALLDKLGSRLGESLE